MISYKRFFKSIRYALRGIGLVVRQEQSFRIQLVAGVGVCIILFTVPLRIWEQVIFLLLIATIFVLEIINSTFERLSDSLKPRYSQMVKDVKDMMAGAVLIASIIAAIVCFIILYPYIIEFISFLQTSGWLFS